MSTQIKLLRGLLANLPAIKDGQLSFTTDQGHIYMDNGTNRIEFYKSDLDALQAELDVLNGNASTAGSVAKAVADLKAALEGTDEDTKDSISIAGAKKYADEAVKVLNDALAAVAKSGKAADVSIEDAGDKLTATTVEAALAELAGMIGDTGEAGAVTVETPDSDDYASVYTFKQNGAVIGTINIPKDMVVQSGTVALNPEGQPAGTYLVLTLANATNDKVYINAGSLIEYVTSGSQASDMVFITVSEDHKVTATITDASITKAKLAKEVTDSLALADSALQNLEAVKYEDAAVANQFVTSVSQADGVISVTRATVDLSALNWGEFTEIVSE